MSAHGSYNGHRPHQGLQRPQLQRVCDVIDLTARIERRRVVDGLIGEYRTTLVSASVKR
jgi:hypothetical protein